METEIKTKVNSYLIFKIGDEDFAACVDEVVNILELQKITKIPKSPAYMKGIINLRGKVLPIIDTRIKLDMTPTEFTDNTCIVVMDLKLENEIIHIGALIDSVVSVSEIEENIIDKTPDIGDSYKSEFISGVANIKGNFIMILNLIKLFTNIELRNLQKSQVNN